MNIVCPAAAGRDSVRRPETHTSRAELARLAAQRRTASRSGRLRRRRRSGEGRPYQFVTDPSLRFRCGASQNLKLCFLIASSFTSTPRPGAFVTG